MACAIRVRNIGPERIMKEAAQAGSFCIERIEFSFFCPGVEVPSSSANMKISPVTVTSTAQINQHANENERGERCSRSSERPAGIHHDQSEHQTCPERRAHG
jgi:hypothetical protein